MDCSKFVLSLSLSLSLENKKEEGAKGHKNLSSLLFSFRVLFSHAQICDSFFQSSKPRFQLSPFFGFFQKGEREEGNNGIRAKKDRVIHQREGTRLTGEIDRNGCCGCREGGGVGFLFFWIFCPLPYLSVRGEVGGKVELFP